VLALQTFTIITISERHYFQQNAQLFVPLPLGLKLDSIALMPICISYYYHFYRHLPLRF